MNVQLATTDVTWRGLTFHGGHGRGRFTFHTLDGWDGWESEGRLTSRAAQHGAFDEPLWAGAKRVRLAGTCATLEERDQLLAELAATFTPGADELAVTTGGATLHARARLVRWAPITPSPLWGAGMFSWAADFVLPDPVKHGELVSVSTPFPELVGGLRYPLYTDGAGTVLGYLDYGDPSTTGVVELTNPGTADAWPQFQVAGPVQGGFEITRVGTPARRVYDGDVPPGSFLVDDTATGVVAMDGDSDRTLTVADPMPVGPGQTAAFAFAPRGPRTAAVLTAGIRPAWW